MVDKLTVYALSTCGWCHKTIEWLRENNVDCEITYVDKLMGEEREQCIQELMQHNSKKSFPTLVVNDGEQVIVGFKSDEMEKALL